MEFFTLDFYGLTRKLPYLYISPQKKIANFSLLGDRELAEKAADEMEKKLDELGLTPDCFVAPEANAVPFVYALATRFKHKRYVVLRKQVKSYMTNPIRIIPPISSPKHLSKLILDGNDATFLKRKKIMLIDDIVSSGATIELATALLEKAGISILARGAIFKQSEDYEDHLIYLSTLPLIEV